jgi:hypothetical protein
MRETGERRTPRTGARRAGPQSARDGYFGGDMATRLTLDVRQERAH